MKQTLTNYHNILTYYMYACSLYCKTLLLILHCAVSFNHKLIIYRTFINDQHKCLWWWKKKRVRKTILSAKYPDLFCLENCHSTSNYESLSNRKMLNTIINMMDDFYHKQYLHNQVITLICNTSQKVTSSDWLSVIFNEYS